MNDIGDDVTITTTIRVDGVLTDPDTVTLDVTSPSNTTSSPSATNPSVGEYEAMVTASEAGRWRYTWTTTDPDSVEHGYFDVSADPPRLDPLATSTDVEDRLGRDLTDDEARRLPALLRDASALVRAYTRQDFDLVTDDVVVLRPIGARLKLPQTPVTAVTSVAVVGGRSDVPDMPLGGWLFDGIDEIQIGAVGWGIAIEWDLELDHGWEPGSYKVVWSHGYATSPDDVVAVVCGMVNRVLTSPTLVEGLTSERIGQYGYQFAQFPGGQSPGATVRLTEADKQALVDAGYRKRSGTIQMRL